MPVVELLVTLGGATVSLLVAPSVPIGLVVPNDSVLLAPLLEPVPIECAPVDELPDGGIVWAEAAVATNATLATNAIKLFIVFLLKSACATYCGCGDRRYDTSIPNSPGKLFAL